MGANQACEVKLFGSWASSYTHRIQLALKLKEIKYEYVEEDLADKSSAFLLHNPVYNKVPVLLHHGRPLAESLVILHYLDDAWPGSPPILPVDPYDRALTRFWCHFVDDKLGPSVGAVFVSSGEEQKKAAVVQVHKNLAVLECELRNGPFKGRRFFGGGAIGILNVVLGCGSYWLPVFEEVAEVKLVDPDSFPLFHSWLRDFEQQEAVTETIPTTIKLLEYARGVRQMMLGFKAGMQPVAEVASADVDMPHRLVPSEELKG